VAFPSEAPAAPEIVARTDADTVEAGVERILAALGTRLGPALGCVR